MQALTPSIKSASDAKQHLYKKGWAFPGEEITLETLTRTLFTAVADNKITPALANPILAVAYLITEKVEECTTLNITSSITKHLLNAFIPITTDIQTRLEDHLQAVNDSNKLHADLANKLSSTQEKLDETSEKVNSNTCTYSQVAAAQIPSNNSAQTPPSNSSYAQIRIQNREEIRRRQVLISFVRTPDLALEAFDEATLTRKSLDSLNTTWASSPDPKPPLPKLKSAILLRTGSLLIELDTATAAEWLKEDAPCDTFLANLGSGASIKNRTYQVIAHFIPIQFNPKDNDHLHQFEVFNGLEPNSLLKVEWIKPVKDRKPNQKVANFRMSVRDPATTNKILKEGASILNRRIVPNKPKKEPIQCLHCQCFGHEHRNCKSDAPNCGRCANNHETNTCSTNPPIFKCINCKGNHPSYNRDCPRFREKCRQTDSCCPENALVFYPTSEPWTWSTFDQPPPLTPHPSTTNPPLPPSQALTIHL